MDAASESGVDEVRETIVGIVEYQPAICRYKVFIIDEVHDLSPKAFDALLKTIEEPPPHIIFVLATTEYNKVPPTIRSRCQKFEFHRASMSDLIARLEHVSKAEGVEAEPAALSAIARMADGGFRDALTLLEQAIITSEGKITLNHVYDQLGLVTEEATDKILLAIKEGDVAQIVTTSGELMRLGRDPRAILESLIYRLADLTRVLFGVEGAAGADASRQAAAHDVAVRIGQDALLSIRGDIAEAHKTIRDISLPRLWLESELIRISQLVSGAKAQQAPAKAATVPEKTAAAPVAPKQNGKAPEAPASEAVVAVVEQKPAEPVREEPSDPQLRAAADVWRKVLAELPEGSPIGMKFAKSRVVAFANDEIVVELGQVHITWINEQPKRAAHIVSLVHKMGGEGWKVAYRKSSNNMPADVPSVELPAEGQQLARMAREVFGS
jgi:DNA polymerase-3 subunit gamma/tau